MDFGPRHFSQGCHLFPRGVWGLGRRETWAWVGGLRFILVAAHFPVRGSRFGDWCFNIKVNNVPPLQLRQSRGTQFQERCFEQVVVSAGV
jgi:hypothetical protein